MDIISWESRKGDERKNRKMFGCGSLNLQTLLEDSLKKLHPAMFSEGAKKNQITFKETTLGE